MNHQWKTLLLLCILTYIYLPVFAAKPARTAVYNKISQSPRYTCLTQLKSGRQPKDVIFSPDGRYLIICPLLENFIQIYDWQEKKMFQREIPVYGRHNGFVEGVFTPDGQEFWFNQMHTEGRVFVMNMANLTLKTNFSSHGNWTKVGEFTPDGRYYYVTSWLSGTVSWFDRADYSYQGRFKVSGTEPRGVDFSPDGRYVYVTLFGSGTVGKYDRLNNHKLLTNLQFGGSCGRIVMDYPRGKAYIGNMRKSSYFVLDLATDLVERQIKTGININNIKLSPDGQLIYVSCRGASGPKGYEYRNPKDSFIEVYSAETYTKVATIPAGNQPIGIGLSKDGKLLAISNFMDDTIDVWEIKRE